MRKIIAKIFKLWTREEAQDTLDKACRKIAEAKRVYYTEVIDSLIKNGTLPLNCDLKLPKASIELTNAETKERVAGEGRWVRLPNDGETLKVTYKPQ